MKTRYAAQVRTVFRYTMAQHYKTRSVRIFLVVMALISLLVFPLLKLIFGESPPSEISPVHTLYIQNEQNIALDTDAVKADRRFEALEIRETDLSDADLQTLLAQEKDAAAAVLSVSKETSSYQITGLFGAESDYTQQDLETLCGALEDALRGTLLRTHGVTAQQMETLSAPVRTDVSRLGGSENSANTNTHTAVSMVYSAAVLLLCSVAMSYIFQSCMEEKASKLVETLLCGADPKALLTGKILAVTCFVFAGTGLFALGLMLSYLLSLAIPGDLSFLREAAENALGGSSLAPLLRARNIPLCILSLLLAYFLIAFLSAIAGACCSKPEDTQQASVIVVVLLLAGYTAGFFIPMADSAAANIFCSLFPATSVFTALPSYICGKIGTGIFALGLALQFASILLLAWLAGAVYHMMILYRGTVPSPRRLLRMLRERRAGAKGGKAA